MGVDVVEQRWPAVALAAIVIVLLLAPRSAALLAFALAALPFVWSGARAAAMRTSRLGGLPTTALVFGAYLAVSVILSVNRTDALGKVVLFFALAAAILLAEKGYRLSTRVDLSSLGRAAVAGCAAALVLLSLEQVLGHPLKTAIYTAFPLFAPDAKHAQLVGSSTIGAGYLTNRSMAVVTLLLLPVLFMAQRLLDGRWRARVTVGLLVLAIIAVLASQHESSQLGLIAAIVVLALGIVRFHVALWLVMAAWVAANALVVPAVQSLYRMDVHLDATIPYSARARVILWNYTASQVPQRLLFGVGLDSTRVLDERRMASAPTLPMHVFPQRTGPHAHNIYLQTWYELGLVGAVLFTVLGLALIAAVDRLSEPVRPYALATFVAAATIGAFSYGLWQPWFMGLFATTVILIVIADAMVKSQCPAGHGGRA